jgi:hypothetical protein
MFDVSVFVIFAHFVLSSLISDVDRSLVPEESSDYGSD